MIKELLRNCLLGFIFGTIIALIAYFGRFQIPELYILVMPIFFAAINLLGSLAAMLVIILLTMKNLVREKYLNFIGFLAAAIVNTVIALVVIHQIDETLLRTDFIFLYFTGMALGAVYGVYRYRNELMRERVRFLEELSEKNQQLQEASRKLAITQERNRMSRDLHDSISQGLHGLTFSIYSLRNQLKDASPDIKATLDHMEATARSTQDELRAMIDALKPSLLADTGLEQAIRTLAELFSQRQNIPVELYIDLHESVSPQVEMTLYRITQEALANIEKHAMASKVSLRLQTDKKQIQLMIKDNGKGFDTQTMSSGHGLRNMRLRAEEAKGMLTIISKQGLGTSVTTVFQIK